MSSALPPDELLVVLLLLLTDVSGAMLMSPLEHAASTDPAAMTVNSFLRFILVFSGLTEVRHVDGDLFEAASLENLYGVFVTAPLRLCYDGSQAFSENRYPLPRTVCKYRS